MDNNHESLFFIWKLPNKSGYIVTKMFPSIVYRKHESKYLGMVVKYLQTNCKE